MVLRGVICRAIARMQPFRVSTPPVPHRDPVWIQTRDRWLRDCDQHRRSDESWRPLRDRTTAILRAELGR